MRAPNEADRLTGGAWSVDNLCWIQVACSRLVGGLPFLRCSLADVQWASFVVISIENRCLCERRMVLMNFELSVVGTLASKDVALSRRLACTLGLFSVDGNRNGSRRSTEMAGSGFCCQVSATQRTRKLCVKPTVARKPCPTT